MEATNRKSSSFSASVLPRRSGGKGRVSEMREDRQRPAGGRAPAKDKIDAFGRLLHSEKKITVVLPLGRKWETADSGKPRIHNRGNEWAGVWLPSLGCASHGLQPTEWAGPRAS